MRIDVLGILFDGSGPSGDLPRTARAELAFPRGADVVVRFTIVTAGNVPLVLAAPDALVVTVKKIPTEGARLTKTATLKPAIGPNIAEIAIAAADTASWTSGRFLWDAWLTRSAKRDPVVPLSPLLLLESVG
jgi:hypothetical protein